MFKHIVVPLDGSLLAESAVPASVFMAEKFHAKITLVHVIEKNAPHEVHGHHHIKNVEEATAYLKDVSRRAFPEGMHVNCHVHTAEVDNVAESIVAHQGELGYDFIIMCSHGRGKLLHLLLGSIAQKVISMGTIPVLITHPGEKGDIPAFSCKAILVPLDGNPDHESTALKVSAEMTQVCESALYLTTVIPRFGTLSGQMTVTSRLLPGTTSKMLEMSMDNAQEYLEEKLEKLRAQGVRANAYVLRGEPSHVITDSARQSQIDLIVLATHGKSGMNAFWAGSMANKVCSRSKVPILLIPVEKTD